MDFIPPGPSERLQAIGGTEGLPELLRRAFDPSSGFEPIPAPKKGDWLASHPEPGQTWGAFIRSKPNKPEGSRKKIYLQPLGEFSPERSPSIEILREYASIFFALPAELCPSLPGTQNFTSRLNPYTRNRQILTTDVLAFLKGNLPADTFCLLAITMEDLYPEPSWNFVFGQASLRERVGVFSFARYDPAFLGMERGKDYKHLLLKRSCKVLAHETAHMFSLAHCIYFSCALNGSNHLQESDSRPMHLCPVCLRKLHCRIGFDVAHRYRQLLDFYERVGFRAEARWLKSRILSIE